MTHVDVWHGELKESLRQLAVASPVYGRATAARRVATAVDALRRAGSPLADRLLVELRDAAAAGDEGAVAVSRLLAGRGVPLRTHRVQSGPVASGIRYTRGPGC